ncbi:MAG TPA: signal peptidase I [Blastocatellia bacterium]|nr:signal peptidase I [Blastocatellia bacterium]
MIEQKETSTPTPTPAGTPAGTPAALRPTFGPPKSTVREYFEQGIITVIMALFLMTFIAQAVAVPTGSMQNTINIGDHLFVNKFVFGQPTPFLGRLLPTRPIERGDIIVFKLPNDEKVNYVKRVIGLPGEMVQVRGRHVFVNGKELAEQRVFVKLTDHRNDSALPVARTEPRPEDAKYTVYYDADQPEDEDGIEYTHGMEYAVKEPFRVPENKYFVMGDSRDNSLDSRYWGPVPREHIFARALYVHWSYNPNDTESAGSGNRLIDMLKRAKWGRIGKAVK